MRLTVVHNRLIKSSSILGVFLIVAGIASGCGGASNKVPVGTPGASTATSVVSPATQGASTTSGKGFAVVSAPGVEANAYGESVIFIIGNKVPSLPQRLSDSRLISPTQFQLVVQGVTVPPSAATLNAIPASSSSIRSVAVAPSSAGVVLTVNLAKPFSHYQIAVGQGDELEVTFS